MNNITIFRENEQMVVSSREVANNFGKQNKHVMEAIREIETSVENSTYLFIKSSYKDSYEREQNEYLLTRDGFSLLVMGFTGQAALKWKLKYIEAFKKMEQALKEQNNLSQLSPQLQLLINLELQQKELQQSVTENKQEIQNMRDVISLDTTSWRKESANLINKIATSLGGYENIKPVRQESYDLLNQRMGVSLETRLTNKKRRMAEEGTSKSKRDKLNYLDIIVEDKKLVEGYVAIVKEMAIKYKIA